MPFAATKMNQEIIMLSKSDREKQIPYDITHMWNLKYDTNELIFEVLPGCPSLITCPQGTSVPLSPVQRKPF